MVAVKEHVDYGDVEMDDYLETYKSSFSFTTWIEVTKYGIPINFNQLFTITVPWSLLRTTQYHECIFCDFIDKNAKVTSDK